MSRGRLLAALAALLLAAGGVFAWTCGNPDLRGVVPAYFVAPGPSEAELAAYKAAVTTAVQSGRSISALFPGEWDEVIAALALKPTDVVADVGAGTGRLEAALIERKAAFATLYAVEPHPQSAAFLQWWISASNLPEASRVKTVRSEWHDVRLPRGGIDVAILLNTPIYVVSPGEPEQMTRANRSSLKSLADAITPGGRLHVFERTNKLALLGGEPCAAIGVALAPLGFRAVEARRMRLDWMGPAYPRHCHAVLERVAS